MKGLGLVLMMIGAAGGPAAAGTAAVGPGFEDAVLVLTGAGCLEEMEESEVERYAALAARPLDLNAASRSRLLSSGLLSVYQVASLVDYRQRTGDILSYSELALVDGFGEGFARALEPFTVLESAGAPGQKRSRRVSQTLMLRGAARSQDGGPAEPAFGVKYGISIGDAAELEWGTRTTYGDPSPTPGTASLAVYGRRIPGKLVAGDIRARFGQGLACWSGFSLSGFSTPEAFSRNATGLGASSSFTQGLHGAGADVSLGKWVLSGAYAFPDGGILNATHIGRSATFGVTLAGNTVSADFKAGFRGTSVFGEAGWCLETGSLAVLAGIVAIPRYGARLTALARYVPAGFKADFGGQARAASRTSDEAGLAFGARLPSLSATLDASLRPSTLRVRPAAQLKGILQLQKELQLGGLSIKPSLKASERLKSGQAPRTDVRADLAAAIGPWAAATRLETVFCRASGWLWYAEVGYKGSWLRWTLFSIDNWEDRIYSYERDAPGNFNTPAYYGRGYSLSAVTTLKFGKKSRQAIHFRLACTSYPWTLTAKPSKLEFKLQYNVR